MEPQAIIKHIPHTYPIVCLCGSTKFKDDFVYWSKWFTLEGCIVVMPMIFGHAGDQITTIQKQELDNLHKAKIKMADIVFIINKNNYIGQSTQSEIAYAKSLNKKILYLEDFKEFKV